MTAPEISRLVLNRFGLRIEQHMSQYVADQMRDGISADIPVIGGDARTGVPRRQVISLQSPFQTIEL